MLLKGKFHEVFLKVSFKQNIHSRLKFFNAKVGEISISDPIIGDETSRVLI